MKNTIHAAGLVLATLAIAAVPVAAHAGGGHHPKPPKPTPTATAPTPEPSEPTEEPTPDPEPTTEPTPEPEPTTEPATEPTTEPTSTPTTTPTTAPTTAPPVVTPPTEPDPVAEAVVELPAPPSGSTWHDCEIGWTYDLDASWDWEYLTVRVTGPAGEIVPMNLGATREGVHHLYATLKPGQTYEGIPVVGLDSPLPAGWESVTTKDGHTTAARYAFTVAFPATPDEACDEPTTAPAATKASPVPSIGTPASLEAPTNGTLAATGASDNLGLLAMLGLAVSGAGLLVLRRVVRR